MNQTQHYATRAFKLDMGQHKKWIPMFEGTIIDPNISDKLSQKLEESIQDSFFPRLSGANPFFQKTTNENFEFRAGRSLMTDDPLFMYVFQQARNLPFEDFVRDEANDHSNQFYLFFRAMEGLSELCSNTISRFEVSLGLTKVDNHRERPFKVLRENFQSKIVDPADYYPNAIRHLEAVSDFVDYVVDVVGETLPDRELNVFSSLEMFIWIRNLGRADADELHHDIKECFFELQDFLIEYNNSEHNKRLQEMYDVFILDTFMEGSYLENNVVNNMFHRRFQEIVREVLTESLATPHQKEHQMPAVADREVREVAWAPSPPESNATSFEDGLKAMMKTPMTPPDNEIIDDEAEHLDQVDVVNEKINSLATIHGAIVTSLEALSPRTRSTFQERLDQYMLVTAELLSYLSHVSFRKGRNMTVDEFLEDRFQELEQTIETVFQGQNTVDVGELLGMIRTMRTVINVSRGAKPVVMSKDIIAAIGDQLEIRMRQATDEYVARMKNALGYNE